MLSVNLELPTMSGSRLEIIREDLCRSRNALMSVAELRIWLCHVLPLGYR